MGTRFSTSFEATNLAANTEYSFVIQSVDSFDVASANSATASATTFADGTSGVSAPTNVVATAISSSRIDVTWDAVSGAVKYYVFQAQGAGPLVYAGTMTSASYLATGLSASTEYSYVIRAVDAHDVASVNSSIASATSLSNAATVSPPTDVAAVALSSSRIDVTWTAVSGAVKYYVFQAEGAGPATYVGTVTSPGFHASGLTLDTTYSYQVASVGTNDVASALSTPPASATTSTENNGVCSVLPSAQQYNASVPRMAVIADFNGDGRNDVALAHQTANSVSIVLATGTSFGSMVDYNTGTNPLSIANADFNNDGNIDLVTGDACNNAPCTTSVLLGNGDGTFATKTSYAVAGINVPRIAAGDVTGDGNADVIAAVGTSVAVLAGNGAGGFAAPSTLLLQPGSTDRIADVQIADIDRDGRLDVVAVNVGVAGMGTASVLGVFLQTPTGFAAPITKALGLWSRSLALGDVNGDGDVDALVADGLSGEVGVVLGNGDGTFGAVTSYVVGTPAILGPPDLLLVRLADVDDDGHVDFVVMLERGSVESGQLVVRRGHSDGTFTTPTLFSGATATGPGAMSFSVGALNADSIPDFVILNQPPGIMSIRYGRCQ